MQRQQSNLRTAQEAWVDSPEPPERRAADAARHVQCKVAARVPAQHVGKARTVEYPLIHLSPQHVLRLHRTEDRKADLTAVRVPGEHDIHPGARGPCHDLRRVREQKREPVRRGQRLQRQVQIVVTVLAASIGASLIWPNAKQASEGKTGSMFGRS